MILPTQGDFTTDTIHPLIPDMSSSFVDVPFFCFSSCHRATGIRCELATCREDRPSCHFGRPDSVEICFSWNATRYASRVSLQHHCVKMDFLLSAGFEVFCVCVCLTWLFASRPPLHGLASTDATYGSWISWSPQIHMPALGHQYHTAANQPAQLKTLHESRTLGNEAHELRLKVEEGEFGAKTKYKLFKSRFGFADSGELMYEQRVVVFVFVVVMQWLVLC